jgi:hypothetical protein
MSATIPPATLAKLLCQDGANLDAKGRHVEARQRFEKALELDPTCGALCNLSVICVNARQYAAAIALGLRFIASGAMPGYAETNLGNVYWRARRFDDALEMFQRAEAIVPDFSGLWHNKGLLLRALGRNEEALAAFDRGIALSHGTPHPNLPYDRSYALLDLGRLKEGLEAHEIRWNGHIVAHASSKVQATKWTGQDIVGKTLLVHHEQGFGDTLMWARYLPLAKALGCRLLVAMPVELRRLIGWMPCVDRVVPHDVSTFDEPIDYHVSMMSLPLQLGATVETLPSDPYFRLAPDAVPTVKPAPCGGMRVGVIWESGRSGLEVAIHRSLSIRPFIELAGINGVDVVSLQVGPAAQEIVTSGARALVPDWGATFKDFADTAVAIQSLDLVVSVDTSVAHLAGALGVPTIVLLPVDPCWRWRWGKDLSRTPLYPSMQLIKQDTAGEWAPVFERLREVIAMPLTLPRGCERAA